MAKVSDTPSCKAGERANRIEDDRVSDPQDDSAEGNMAPWQRVSGSQNWSRAPEIGTKAPFAQWRQGPKEPGKVVAPRHIVPYFGVGHHVGIWNPF